MIALDIELCKKSKLKIQIRPVSQTIEEGGTKLEKIAEAKAREFVHERISKSLSEPDWDKYTQYNPVGRKCQSLIVRGDLPIPIPDVYGTAPIIYANICRAAYRQDWKQVGSMFLPSPMKLIQELGAKSGRTFHANYLYSIMLKAFLYEDLCTVDEFNDLLRQGRKDKNITSDEVIMYRLEFANALERRGEVDKAEVIRKLVLNTGTSLSKIKEQHNPQKKRALRVEGLLARGMLAFQVWEKTQSAYSADIAIECFSTAVCEDRSKAIAAPAFAPLLRLIYDERSDELKRTVEDSIKGWKSNPRPLADAVLQIMGNARAFRELKMKVFTVVVDCCPYDANGVLELVKVMQKLSKGSASTMVSCFEKVCRCLDDPSNGNDIRLWLLLVDILRKLSLISRDEQLPLCIYDIVSSPRVFSWKKFYFSSTSPDDSERFEMLGCRAFVCWMILPDSLGTDYVKSVKALVPSKTNIPPIGSLKSGLKQLAVPREYFQKQILQVLEPPHEEQRVPIPTPEASELKQWEGFNPAFIYLRKCKPKSSFDTFRGIRVVPPSGMSSDVYNNPRPMLRAPERVRKLPWSKKVLALEAMKMSGKIYERVLEKLRVTSSYKTPEFVEVESSSDWLAEETSSESLGCVQARSESDKKRKTKNQTKLPRSSADECEADNEKLKVGKTGSKSKRKKLLSVGSLEPESELEKTSPTASTKKKSQKKISPNGSLWASATLPAKAGGIPKSKRGSSSDEGSRKPLKRRKSAALSNKLPLSVEKEKKDLEERSSVGMKTTPERRCASPQVIEEVEEVSSDIRMDDPLYIPVGNQGNRELSSQELMQIESQRYDFLDLDLPTDLPLDEGNPSSQDIVQIEFQQYDFSNLDLSLDQDDPLNQEAELDLVSRLVDVKPLATSTQIELCPGPSMVHDSSQGGRSAPHDLMPGSESDNSIDKRPIRFQGLPKNSQLQAVEPDTPKRKSGGALPPLKVDELNAALRAQRLRALQPRAGLASGSDSSTSAFEMFPSDDDEGYQEAKAEVDAAVRNAVLDMDPVRDLLPQRVSPSSPVSPPPSPVTSCENLSLKSFVSDGEEVVPQSFSPPKAKLPQAEEESESESEGAEVEERKAEDGLQEEESEETNEKDAEMENAESSVKSGKKKRKESRPELSWSEDGLVQRTKSPRKEKGRKKKKSEGATSSPKSAKELLADEDSDDLAEIFLGKKKKNSKKRESEDKPVENPKPTEENSSDSSDDIATIFLGKKKKKTKAQSVKSEITDEIDDFDRSAKEVIADEDSDFPIDVPVAKKKSQKSLKEVLAEEGDHHKRSKAKKQSRKSAKELVADSDDNVRESGACAYNERDELDSDDRELIANFLGKKKKAKRKPGEVRS